MRTYFLSVRTPPTMEKVSVSAERSGQARAREWGNSYRHAELSEQSTKQARRARWRQAHFTGFSSAPALHWATACTLAAFAFPRASEVYR